MGGGGAGGEGQPDAGKRRRVVGRDVPHTEDVTGRVDTNRLSAAASAAHRDSNPEPPHDDSPPTADADGAVIRRLVTRAPREPS
jgi:hypothetical protein